MLKHLDDDGELNMLIDDGGSLIIVLFKMQENMARQVDDGRIFNLCKEGDHTNYGICADEKTFSFEADWHRRPIRCRY